MDIPASQPDREASISEGKSRSGHGLPGHHQLSGILCFRQGEMALSAVIGEDYSQSGVQATSASESKTHPVVLVVGQMANKDLP